jgi:protein subunit release factor A
MIDKSDLEITVWRSSTLDGPLERAVRVVHIPSGTEGLSRGKASEAEDVAAAIAEIEEKLRRRFANPS